MKELIITGILSSALLLCILLDLPILVALLFGLVIFSMYAFNRGYKFRKILLMWLVGIKSVKSMLITYILIGMLTALWRQSGVISALVYYMADFFSPEIIVPATFLLCALTSTLTGTAFGTCATMGFICASVSKSFGVPLWLIGGAILGGAYLGDRCSPMSTSALLVSTLTRTNLLKNLVGFFKTSIIPIILSTIAYYIAGTELLINGVKDVNVREIFVWIFNIHPTTLTPAIIIVVLSLFKVRVQKTMLVSIISAVIIAIFLQNASPLDVLINCIIGYSSPEFVVNEFLGGGGIISMANVFAIVCISSCYAGIFQRTGFLRQQSELVNKIGEIFSSQFAVIISAIMTSLISCNQTLAIMLTHQLCKKVEPDGEKLALYMANSAVIMSPLIPWSISNVVPLTLVKAPSISLIGAWYLWLCIICNIRFFRR